MPSIAQTPPGRVESKKRRRDDDEVLRKANVHFSPQHHNPHSPYHGGQELEETWMDSKKESHWKPMAGKPMRHLSKRARVSSHHDTGFDGVNGNRNEARQDIIRSTVQGNTTVHDHAAGGVVVAKKIDLRACHICRRRPSDRAQLDQYADCEGCGARTCFVCMRQCEGYFGLGIGEGLVLDVEGDFDCLAGSFERSGIDFGIGDGVGNADRGETAGRGEDGGGGIWEKGRMAGHRGKVCRECCVELGAEGEVRCLGCYRVGEP